MKKYFFIIILIPSLLAYATPECGFSEALETLKSGKNNKVMGELFARETMQHTLITPSSNFAIHYDTQGINAVDNVDLNQNSIPDYIDSAAYYIDSAYKEEVIMLGFPFSPIDSNSGGTAMYDIYVKEFAGSPYYGLTQPESSSFPGNVNFRTSYIVIDNNFSKEEKKYRTTGIDGLKITLFHEFNHAIQFYMTDNLNPVLAEMSSTFMEYRFFPYILDYVQWLDKWFNAPETLSIVNDYSASAGYGLSLFFQYTYKKFGDGVVLNSWLNLAKGMNDVEAMNESLKLKGSSLSDAFCELPIWMYHTGSKAIGNRYFDNAENLPELKISIDTVYKENNIELLVQLAPFTFSPQQVILENDRIAMNDTLLLLLTNTDYDNAKEKILSKSLAKYVISKDGGDDFTKFGKLDYYYKDDSSPVFCNTAFELLGQKGLRYVEAYPNPFLPSSDETLHLPAPENSRVYDRADIEIYTPNMVVVYAGKKDVTVHKGQFVLDITNSDVSSFENGFYLFKATVDDKSVVGKFMVKK